MALPLVESPARHGGAAKVPVKRIHIYVHEGRWCWSAGIPANKSEWIAAAKFVYKLNAERGID